MSQVKIEAFLSTSAGSGDASLSKLLEEIEKDFGSNVEITFHKGHNKLFEEYNLTTTPAVVVEELVKIMGFCPSKETLISALRDAGLE